MDDKELPGFKINDYSGGGDDAAEEAEHIEGPAVAGDVQLGEASTAGGAAENGSVTHGEGDFSAVMLENEHVGGAEEKAPKTAPEAPEEYSGDSEEASDEPKADGRVEASTRITEAEARAMLVEDNARVKEALKKANSRGKKTLAVVIVIAVLLVIAGVATSIILGGMRKSDGEGFGDSDKQEGNGENTAVVEKPEEEPEEPEAVELSLDDEVVQELYKRFRHAESPWDDGVQFYAEAVKGDLSRDQIIKMAFYSLQTQRVEVENGSEEINHCKGVYYISGNEEWPAMDCYSGEEMRSEITRLFGFNDYAFVEDDEAATACRYPYSTENDEFYQTKFCGGAASSAVSRKLYKAEKDDERLYLYEKAVFWSSRTGSEGFYRLGKDGWDVRIGELSWGEPWFELVTDVLDDPRSDELLDKFKWTFEKNGEGNYVFKGLERVN